MFRGSPGDEHKFAEAQALDETSSAVRAGMMAHAEITNHRPENAQDRERRSALIGDYDGDCRVAAFLPTKKPVPAPSYAC